MITERMRLVLKLRSAGDTFAVIASKLGVSKTRASEIYSKASRLMNRSPHWSDGLSVRAANVLNNCSIQSKKDAAEAFKIGILRPGLYPGPRNYGKTTQQEIANWLGLTMPKKAKRGIRCPICGGSF